MAQQKQTFRQTIPFHLIWMILCLTGPLAAAAEKTQTTGPARIEYPRVTSSLPREQNALNRFYELEKTATKASLLERFMADNPFPKVIVLTKLRIAEMDFTDVETKNPFASARPGNGSWDAFVKYYAFGEYLPIPDDPQLREIYYGRLHRLLIRALGQSNSFDAWMRYLTNYSQNPYFLESCQQVEKHLLTLADKWNGYDMLKVYLQVIEEKTKKPCPNRDKLVARFQEGLAATVEREDNREQYRRYLQAFPNSPQRKRIKIREDNLDLTDASVRSDRAKMKEIIQKYEKDPDPNARTVSRRAINFLERLEFNDTMTSNTAAAFQAFRDRYKDRDHANLVPAVEDRLKRLHDEMFVKAKAAGNSALYRAFLTSFPDAPQRAEAEKALEEALFKEAMAAGNRKALTALLTQYPNSRLPTAGANRLEDLDFEQGKKSALAGPTTAPLKTFMDRYPAGRHIGEAKELTAQINGQHAEYADAIQKARDAHNASSFSAWLTQNHDNMYTDRRGPQDLDALKRDLAIEQLYADLATTPASSLRAFPIALTRALNDCARALATIDNGGTTGTGLLFGADGLLLAEARLLRNVAPDQLRVKNSGQVRPCRIVSVAASDEPPFGILRLEGVYEPIRLGNPTILAPNEELICVSLQGGKLENVRATYIGTRRVGDNDWLVIQSSTAPTTAGAVVLNQRARAVALLPPQSQIDPSVKDPAGGQVYALSLRTALPAMERAIRGK